MAEVLTAPFAATALVLCVAGVTKLRAPATAVAALSAARLPSRPWLVRAFACFELALGLACVAAPGRVVAGALACCYAGFAALAVLLARRRASCGCFGAADAPASAVQAVLSGVLAVVALGAVFAPPHWLGWHFGMAPGSVSVLILGTAGAAYGTVLAYTELPQALTAWSSS